MMSENDTRIDDVICPDVHVDLVGRDGNAFAIMGRVRAAMRKAGVAKEIQDAYLKEATSGNYDHLLATTMKYVNTDGEDD